MNRDNGYSQPDFGIDDFTKQPKYVFTSYTALHVIKAIACLKLPHATFLYARKNSRNNCSLIFYK